MAKATYVHRLRWDIAGLSAKQRVLDAFPELAAYPVFVQHGSGADDGWLRFALYYADKGSALQQIGELERKKREALRLAGLPADSERARRVLAWQDEGVVALVNLVVLLMHSRKYTAWFHGSLMYNQTAEMLSVNIEAEVGGPPTDEAEGLPGRPVEGDLSEDKKQRAYETRNKNWTAIRSQEKDLEELENLIFMNDEQLAAAQKETMLRSTGGVGRRASSQTFVEH